MLPKTSQLLARKVRQTIEVTRAIFDQVQVGKTYLIDGRKAKVVEKVESPGALASGWMSTRPMITVVWR